LGPGIGAGKTILGPPLGRSLVRGETRDNGDRVAKKELIGDRALGESDLASCVGRTIFLLPPLQAALESTVGAMGISGNGICIN